MKYYFRAFKNYAKCDGRATRREYWWFTLFHYIAVFILAFLDGLFGFYTEGFDYGYMTLIYLFASACPSICLQVRRLHDVGKSGGWWIARNMPILSWYVFYLNLKPSEPLLNDYGFPPDCTPMTASNEVVQANSSNEIRFCRKCGYELVNGSDFCSQCGTEIIKNVGVKEDEVL